MKYPSFKANMIVQKQVELIGLGDLGLVYLAKALLQGPQVAIKVPTVNLLSIGQNSRIYVPLKVLHPAPFHSPI